MNIASFEITNYDHQTSIRKLLLFPSRVSVVILIACLLGTGCTTTKDPGTSTSTETSVETTEPNTSPACSYRPDPTPPAYTWNYQTVSIGQATASYFYPPAPIGLVVLFDGGGGSRIWFNQIEPRLLVETLVDANYAVMALESDDPRVGNFDETDAATNVDIVNLQTAIDLAHSSGAVPAGTPLFYLGFSSGGYFASLATRYVPANAMVLLNVRGYTNTFNVTSNPSIPPPTLWVIGRNDPLVAPDDTGLNANLVNIANAGVDHELYINEPIGAKNEAFARISDPSSAVSATDSTQAVTDLKAGGYLNQSTGDSYTRLHRYGDITRLHGSPSVPMSCGSI